MRQRAMGGGGRLESGKNLNFLQNPPKYYYLLYFILLTKMEVMFLLCSQQFCLLTA